MSAAPLRALVAAEMTKARRQPSTYVLGGILVGYLALVVGALSTILATPPGRTGAPDMGAILAPLRDDAVGFVAGIAASIATILLVVFAAQIVAQEFARGTLRTLLLHGARRGDVMRAKLVVIFAAALAFASLAMAGGLVGALVFSAVTGEALLHGGVGDWAIHGSRILVGLVAWGAIAFGATLATRSLGVGIGATLGGLIAGDALGGLLASLGPAGLWLSRAMPNAAIAAISSSRGVQPAAWAWIVPSLLVYVVGLNVYALWQLARLDVIAATK